MEHYLLGETMVSRQQAGSWDSNVLSNLTNNNYHLNLENCKAVVKEMYLSHRAAFPSVEVRLT